MRNTCLWSTVALFAITLCLLCHHVSSYSPSDDPLYKVHENQQLVDFKACGDLITWWWEQLCTTKRRKRRSMFLDEKEALGFLDHQIQRHRRSVSNAATDIVEECCQEGCAYEEMYEYC